MNFLGTDFLWFLCLLHFTFSVSPINFCAVSIAVFIRLSNFVSLSVSNSSVASRKSRLSSPSETAVISRIGASFSMFSLSS